MQIGFPHTCADMEGKMAACLILRKEETYLDGPDQFQYFWYDGN